eukprot:10990663-Karenia_brevis.AAC.1
MELPTPLPASSRDVSKGIHPRAEPDTPESAKRSAKRRPQGRSSSPPTPQRQVGGSGYDRAQSSPPTGIAHNKIQDEVRRMLQTELQSFRS